MTAGERIQLVRQIYETEIQYLEIRKKAEVLQVMPSRTPQQDAALADYLTKLQHDRDVVTIWVNALQADGVGNPRTLADRSTVLENLRQNILDEETRRLTEIAEVERTGKQAGQTDAEHAAAIDALRTKIQNRRTTLEALIVELQADTRFAWQR